MALIAAAGCGRELPFKFLLQRTEDETNGDVAAYVNARDEFGQTALMSAIGFTARTSPSTRIVRLLVDAGADPAPVIRAGSIPAVHATPLELTTSMLREKKVAGKDATEEHLHKLEGIRRLLLRVEAVHAVSFLWPVDVPFMFGTTEGKSKAMATSIPLRVMPISRRRAR